MRKVVIAGAILVVATSAGLYGWRAYSGPPAPTPQAAVGQKVADFTLPDTQGQVHSLASLRGSRGTLLIYISTRCPVSNNYNIRMEALNRDYGARGIRVVGINANRTEPVDEVRRHAQEKGLTFLILKDEGNRIADYFGASVTPEAYLVDTEAVLRYHGRLDADQYEPALNADEIRAALDAFLEGRTLVDTGKKAFGCTIKRVSG